MRTHTLTTSVSADGAYVLWLHSMLPSEGIDQWTAGGSSESLEECRSAAVVAMKNLARRYPSDRVRVDGPTLRVTLSSGNTAAFANVCLPDTVDPRGPKRK